jgi:hypothetical protein
MNPITAKKIIRDLMDAGSDNARVEGGSRAALSRAERQTDAAIRFAWRAMTGHELTGDPVEFIYAETLPYKSRRNV